MTKYTLDYEDFDGNKRTEEFVFNLTPAELMELQNSLNGGLHQLLEKIVAEKDQAMLFEYFKKIVLASYGIKSLDGRTITKNDKIREEFESTAAYSEIFMDLATDADKASKFLKEIMPSEETMKKYTERLEKMKATSTPSAQP
jgi:hypothetical protein